MLATSTGSRAIFLVLAICLVGGRSTYAQSASSLNPSKSIGNRMSSGAWLAKCAAFSMPTLAGIPTGEADEWPPIPSGTTADAAAVRYPNPLCVEPALSATSRGPALASADNPCGADAVGGSDIPRSFPCNASADAVPAELSALGKAGAKIARARKEVLNILLAENACTEWFETKELSPAATFQSLSFFLDRHGPPDIFESTRERSIVVRRQPYVARTTQDGGAHTAITINANGAFYKPQGQVLKIGREAGPVQSEGTRLLTVGSYMGDTLPAQMVTLLHEFGHVIDLLPEDADNLDGKSVKNTDEVLRHCRSEVESRAQQAKETAKR